MAETFNRPIQQLASQDEFSNSEVGITHPHNPSFVRLLDNGDAEIIVKDGLGIVINASSQTITFMGHAIRFLTTDENGLVWNRTAFNDKATTYTESSLLDLNDSDLKHMFQGIDNYIPGSNG